MADIQWVDAGDLVVLLTTVGSDPEAQRIAEALVDERLAACVGIVPQMRSVYRWQGRVELADEWQLQIKTRRELVPRAARRLGELHGYDLPELIAMPVTGGSAEYLDWLRGQTGSG